jgi:thiol:disulfide interchange protein DsbG
MTKSRLALAAVAAFAFGISAGVSVASAAAPTATHATQVAPAAQAGAQGILDHLSRGQAKIKKTFAGPAGSGLTGLVVDLGVPGREMVAFTTHDGKYMIVGGVFDAAGTNYSLKAMQAYLPPAPAPANAQKNFEDLSKAHLYLWGKADAAKELWVLVDPDCIFCHKLYVDLAPLVASGRVKVHVIQAGFLKPDALGKAAAILGAKNPAAALVEDEGQFDVATEEGGIKPDLTNGQAIGWAKQNNEWMQSHGIGGTPYVMYRDLHGKVGVVAGYPSDINALLTQVGSAAK